MADFEGILTPAPSWDDIPQATTQMSLKGGPGGPLNEQAQRLLNRTEMAVRRATVPILSFDGANVPDKALIYFADRDTVGDGGGGPLRFLKGSTATADGVTVYAVTGGRLVREGWSVFGVNPLWAGAKGDGVVDDTTAMVAAKTTADAYGVYLNIDGGNYKVAGTFEMPLRVKGYGTITGNIAWTQRKYISQIGKLTVVGNVLLSGVWHADTAYIDNSGFDFTLDGNSSVWGTFWNKFGAIRTNKLIFDVDQGQSINQNVFETVRASAGVHIKGVNTTGTREAHNNTIINLDTTGANLTAVDGTTGIHVLNDSNLNQANTIINWYAEISGSRRAYGNWNILGSNVDSVGGPYMIGRGNSTLFAGGTSRNGSFLAASQNVARGGDWRTLTASGIPPALAGSSITPAVISGAPDGLTVGAKQTGGATFRAIDIRYPLCTSGHVTATAWVYQEGSPSTTVEIIGAAGAVVSSGVASYTPLGGGWYLLRVSGTGDVGNGGTEGRIRIYTTTSSALTASDFRILGSFHVTNEATALLPAATLGPREAFGTTAPTAGIWAQGDRAWNTAPTAGGAPGWVCTTGGQFGTLSGVTASTTSASAAITLSSASGLAVGMSITIAGVTGTKRIVTLSGTSATVDSVCDATVASGAVAYVTPIFKAMASLAA